MSNAIPHTLLNCVRGRIAGINRSQRVIGYKQDVGRGSGSLDLRDPPGGGSVHPTSGRSIVIRRWGVSSSGRPSSDWWLALMRATARITVYGGRIRYSVGCTTGSTRVLNNGWLVLASIG